MQLSKHFSLQEFTYSPTAVARKIRNEPGPEHLANLKLLVEKVLEPIREHFGKPVKVNSGYRSPALNRAVGGSLTSQHSNGQAADIEIDGIANAVLAQWISENLEYDQLILEFYNPNEGPSSGWVHVSYSSTNNRKEKLIALKNGRKTTYTKVARF